MDKDQRFEMGLKTRREVVGDAAVDAALKAADEFSMPMQELVTQYCWGDIWNRPGLARRDRSLLNLGILAAQGYEHELKGHIRGALRNGVTKAEIREALLQVAVYCGMPAGSNGFKAAREVFAEASI